MHERTHLSNIALSLRTQFVIYLCLFIDSGSLSSRDKLTPLLKPVGPHMEQPIMFDLEWKMSWTWSFDIVVQTFLLQDTFQDFCS